jgi:hypothetical protein
MSKPKKLILGGSFFLAVLFFFGWQLSLAEERNLQQICQPAELDKIEQESSREEYQQLLKDCLAYYEKYYQVQEDVYQNQLSEVQGSRQTLEGELAYLGGRIQALEAQIQESQLIVRDLTLEIEDKGESIKVTQKQIEDYRLDLADLLQLTYQYDKQPIVLEILAGEQNLADIFRSLVVLDSLNERFQERLQGAKDLKVYLEEQQSLREIEKEDLEKEIVLHSFQEDDLVSTKETKDELLERTKGQEQIYQQQLKKVQTEAEEKAEELRSRLFRLIDVPEGGIKFGQAVEVAESTALLTGIDPAFLLAILAQESSEIIGANVGGCYLTNAQTGNGTYIKSGGVAPRTMKPSRDVPVFLELTEKLGRDWKETPVSCCIFRNGQPWGWGGAMGPAQFIPSTWVLFEEQVQTLLQKETPANPWAIQDSFLASALYLRQLGADGTYRGQLNAALSYFGCSSAYCVSFYGQPVLERSQQYREEIKIIHQAE